MYDSSRSEKGSDSALRLESESFPQREPIPGNSSTESGRRMCRMLSVKACRTSGSSLEPVASYASILVARRTGSALVRERLTAFEALEPYKIRPPPPKFFVGSIGSPGPTAPVANPAELPNSVAVVGCRYDIRRLIRRRNG
uniref:Uncharacterized protein n=1 Tax=Anopheles culicifacies TaxID=139723 RepID=A0A182LXN9_9DIPT